VAVALGGDEVGRHGEPTRVHVERDDLIERRRWAEALEVQTRLLQEAPRDRRAAEERILAGLHYEVARDRLEGSDRAAAMSHLKEALRLQPGFVPAALLLGDTHLKAGEPREALRVWERAAEASHAALPLLGRLEQLHRTEGRPTRMISLYQDALARHPDNQALAFGLGRVYFELTMLDEAAEQFQKMEVRAPDLPQIHAYLGAILERRGPKSLEVCALLHKHIAKGMVREARWVGFDCPQEFVIGYGLDHSEKYRHLPFVGVIEP
jgi:tetratricopeptide (TPR) repeat protein